MVRLLANGGSHFERNVPYRFPIPVAKYPQGLPSAIRRKLWKPPGAVISVDLADSALHVLCCSARMYRCFSTMGTIHLSGNRCDKLLDCRGSGRNIWFVNRRINRPWPDTQLA